MTHAYLRRVARSAAFYPVTVVYLAAVLALIGVVGGVLSLEVGLTALGFVAMLVVLVSMRGDVGQIHVLVNSQHDALLERVDELLDALHEAGVAAPKDKAGVDRDRRR
jgi:hypothetical protein